MWGEEEGDYGKEEAKRLERRRVGGRLGMGTVVVVYIDMVGKEEGYVTVYVVVAVVVGKD